MRRLDRLDRHPTPPSHVGAAFVDLVLGRGGLMYVDCSCGSRHWGHLGAAGLLLTDPDRTGVVLQHRSPRVHQGDTWGVPGGAIDAGEDAVAAALREAHEEAGIEAG